MRVVAAYAVACVCVCLLLPGADAGAQGTNVGTAGEFAKTIPRFTGPSRIPEPGDVSLSQSGDSQDYAINLGILAGIGIVFALFILVWALGRCCFAKCCKCWVCSCCAKRGDDHHGWAIAVAVFCVITLAFCIYGYVANSKTNDALVGEKGLSKFGPSVVDRIKGVVEKEETELIFIRDTATGVISKLRLEQIPDIEDDVANGTTLILDLISGIKTKVTSTYTEYVGEYSNYSCVACTVLGDDFTSLETEINDQTADIVDDFQSIVDDIKSELINIEDDIEDRVNELLNTTGDIKSDADQLKADLEEQTDEAEGYEEYRRIAFIVIFLFPIITLLLIIIGTCRKSSGGHGGFFTAAAYTCFLYAFLMFLIFSVHVILSTVSSDACVYVDDYETGGLIAEAQACKDGVSTHADLCTAIENAKGCLFDDDLVEINNASKELNFSSLEFPDIPDVNTSFTFDELTEIKDFIAILGPQDFGVPQCYIDALLDDFNGDNDASITPAVPATPDWLRRALWIQEHLGYALPYPRATEIGTHNSFNRDHIRTHITINTTVINQAITINENPTNQQFTLNDQLTYLGVRRLELDAKYIEANASSPHCETGTSVAERTRVCHANSGTATSIRDGCGNDVGWPACEALCICDFGDDTACGVNPPLFTDVLAEIDRWLDSNPDEVISLYIENGMNGFDTEFETFLTTAFGARLFLPTASTDYTDVANWPTRAALIGSGAQVVVFSEPSDGSSCDSNGFASPSTMPHVLCHTVLRASNRHPVSTVDVNTDSFCDDSTQVFFHYITGTTVTNQIVYGTTDSSDDNTNGGANTITPAKMTSIVLECGLSPDLDQVDVDLVRNALWSLGDEQPADFGNVVTFAFIPSGTNRWNNTDQGTDTKRCACVDTSDPLSWSITANAVAFADCNTECSGSTAFSVPRSNKEANNLIAAIDAAGGSPDVWLHLRFLNSQLDFSAEGAGFEAWPNTVVTNQARGAGHTSEVDEAGMSALTAGSFAAPYDQVVTDAQQLINDKAGVLVRRDDIVNDFADLETEADRLLNVWTQVDAIMENITADTEPIVDAAERAVDILATCGDLEQSYFDLKITVCDEFVEGVSGITFASFVLGLSAIFMIIGLGPLIEGWRQHKVAPDDFDDAFNANTSYGHSMTHTDSSEMTAIPAYDKASSPPPQGDHFFPTSQF